MNSLYSFVLQEVNFDYDICSLIILSVIVFSMIIRKAMKGLSNKLFFFVVICTAIACLADIFSEIPSVTRGFRLFCDYAYFIFTTIIPVLYILYVYANVGILFLLRNQVKRRIAIHFPFFVVLVILIVNLIITNIYDTSTISKWFYAFDVIDNKYIRGNLQPVLIGCCLAYLVIGALILIKSRRIIPNSRFWPLMMMCPSIVAGLAIQQIWQGFEMTLFGLTIGILIISFTIQRSDENIDEIMGIKDWSCFSEELRKVFATNHEIYVIFIRINNQSKFRRKRGIDAYNRFLRAICNCIKHVMREKIYQSKSKKIFGHLYDIYSLNDGNYAITIDTTDFDLVSNIGHEISSRLKNDFEVGNVAISLESKICLVHLPADFDNLDSLANFQENFHTKFPDSSDDVVTYSEFCGTQDFYIRNHLDTIIANAIKNKRFQMYYQPIYSIKEKKFVSAEALIRLIDEKYGFVSPALFIPAAEASGAIHDIGDYVIDEVCRFAGSIDFENLGLKYIEFNLSAAQCIELDLAEKIMEATKRYKIKPDQVNLEITESSADRMYRDSIINLSENGYNFSLDDYGTGQSNFKRLFDLPFDIIKFDKLFADNHRDYYGKIAIESLIPMFKTMKKSVLVEGIETLDAAKYFEELGCEYLQGFYYSKPIPEQDFVKFLKENNCKETD